MKNIPDNDMFDELGKRLANYEEKPDDDTWKVIAAAIPATAPSGGFSIGSFSAGFLVAGLTALMVYWLSNRNEGQTSRKEPNSGQVVEVGPVGRTSSDDRGGNEGKTNGKIGSATSEDSYDSSEDS